VETGYLKLKRTLIAISCICIAAELILFGVFTNVAALNERAEKLSASSETVGEENAAALAAEFASLDASRIAFTSVINAELADKNADTKAYYDILSAYASNDAVFMSGKLRALRLTDKTSGPAKIADFISPGIVSALSSDQVFPNDEYMFVNYAKKGQDMLTYISYTDTPVENITITYFYDTAGIVKAAGTDITLTDNVMDSPTNGNVFSGGKIITRLLLTNGVADDIKNAILNNKVGEHLSVFTIDTVPGITAVVRHNSLVHKYNILPTVLVLMAIFCALEALFVLWYFAPLKTLYDLFGEISKGKYNAHENLRINDVIRRNTLYKDIIDVIPAFTKKIEIAKYRYSAMIETTENIIFTWDLSNDSVEFSNTFMKKFAHRAKNEKFENSYFAEADVEEPFRTQFAADVERMKLGKSIEQAEYRLKNIYGDYTWFMLRATAVTGYDGNAKIIGIISDINRGKQNSQSLVEKASFDSLTKAYNRKTAEMFITEELGKIKQGGDPFAILFIDVDNFKHYNDNYSHATGDSVLRFVVSGILSVISDYGFVARFGGDEFLVCTRHVQINDPALAAQKILTVLNDGFNSDDNAHLSVSVSIGIAVIRDYIPYEKIVSMSDDAMYRVKKNGKGNYGFITQ
jgi:diguanylate cyclase (GGDEF)-like protein